MQPTARVGGAVSAQQDLSADDVVRAVVVIIQAAQQAARPNTTTCPADGCLIVIGRRCPACDVRNGLQLGGRRPTPEPDPKRPVRWVKRGATRQPVYAERSEVA